MKPVERKAVLSRFWDTEDVILNHAAWMFLSRKVRKLFER